jgi:hypothetical protein
MTKKNKYSLSAIVVVAAAIFVLGKTISSNKEDAYQFTCGVAPTQINTNRVDTSLGIKLVFNPPFRWRKHILEVLFTDITDYALMQKTLNIANEWSKSANIKFNLSTESFNSDIRVSFRESRGYLSAIGNSANDKAYQNKATLWLQNLDTRTDNEFRRVVLHEFGHAIGLEHELQSPNSNIQWDSSAVYTYYDTTYHWSQQKVNDFVFKKFDTAKYTRFDPNSVMIYAVPAFLTKNHKEIAWPDNLSLLDKQTIKQYYPF